MLRVGEDLLEYPGGTVSKIAASKGVLCICDRRARISKRGRSAVCWFKLQEARHEPGDFILILQRQCILESMTVLFVLILVLGVAVVVLVLLRRSFQKFLLGARSARR